MKAWYVREKGEFAATIVFAETRGKAKALAQKTDCCQDVAFCDIEVRREPKADCCYEDGKREMDWNDAKDRIFLVAELGFYCECVELSKCGNCSAKDCCYEYFEALRNNAEEGKDNAEEQFKDNPSLYFKPNYYFLANPNSTIFNCCQSAMFRSSHVKKIKEV